MKTWAPPCWFSNTCTGGSHAVNQDSFNHLQHYFYQYKLQITVLQDSIHFCWWPGGCSFVWGIRSAAFIVHVSAVIHGDKIQQYEVSVQQKLSYRKGRSAVPLFLLLNRSFCWLIQLRLTPIFNGLSATLTITDELQTPPPFPAPSSRRFAFFFVCF